MLNVPYLTVLEQLEDLPSTESLSAPNSAEQVLLVQMGHKLVTKLIKM